MREKPIVFCLMGPTACGKTDLAIELVKRFPLSIISVDSAMIYRGMDIGTAKPGPQQLAIAPHALIDICDPTQSYSAGNFCQDAEREIKLILAKGKIPLLVGGSMLYYRALQQGIAELPVANAEVRRTLEEKLQVEGLNKLYQQLQAIDPLAAKKIHPHDPQRILRALAVYRQTGKTISELQQRTAVNQHYQFVNLGLLLKNRQLLHQRIADRFAQMLDLGLVAEVERLMQRGDLHLDLPSMRTVGYRQVWRFLAGDYDYQEMQLRGVYASRQLAKRQLTWLRSWPNLQEFFVAERETGDHIYQFIDKLLSADAKWF